MPAHIVTQEDLEGFKDILLQHNRITLDRWIKSNSVMGNWRSAPGPSGTYASMGPYPIQSLEGSSIMMRRRSIGF